MKEIDILPGDNDGYFLTLVGEEGPHQGGTISIDMNKAGNYVRKLKYDAFLGDFT